MDRIVWDKSFEIGVEEVDLQHQYFAGLINRLLAELEGSNEMYQLRLIRELDAYARFHFISEENLMFRAGYPDLEEHRQQHFALIDALNARQMMFSSKRISAVEVIEFLKTWFVGHTGAEDRKFGDFVRARVGL